MANNDAVENLLDTLRETYPSAWFMIVPQKITQLNVPMTVNRPTIYDLEHKTTEPEFQIEHIEIRQSELVPSLWWGYGEKSNRLAYWIEEK